MKTYRNIAAAYALVALAGCGDGGQYVPVTPEQVNALPAQATTAILADGHTGNIRRDVTSPGECLKLLNSAKEGGLGLTGVACEQRGDTVIRLNPSDGSITARKYVLSPKL